MSTNPIRPWRDIYRRQSRKIRVGAVEIGGDAPISVQTMTNTLTSDAEATIAQVQACAEAGADIVRVSCPDKDSTAALKQIVRAVDVRCAEHLFEEPSELRLVLRAELLDEQHHGVEQPL